MQTTKKAQAGMVGIVITVVVAVIIGVVALQVVDDESSKIKEPQDMTGETFTGSNTTYVSLTEDNWFSNATCNCSPFTANLSAGSIIHTNDTCNGQTVSCDYSYYDDAYAESSSTRTITGLVPTVFAVVLLTIITAGLIMTRT